MSLRIGLGVGLTEIRALALEDGKVVWHAARALDGIGAVEGTVAALLSARPRRRLRSARVVAALSPALSHTKKLAGLPPTADKDVVTRLVRANATRFFLRAETATSAPVVYRNGTWWGAVFHGDVLAGIERACARGARGSRLTFVGCIPTVAALASFCRDGAASSSDGRSSLSIQVSKGMWLDVRRGAVEEGGPATLPPSLARLGDDAPRFADAFAAAAIEAHAPLLLRVGEQHAFARPLVLRRAALVFCCTAALVGSLVSRGLKASLQYSRDRAQLAAAAPRGAEWAQASQQLAQSTDALAELARFLRMRDPVVPLVAGMSKALPDSTAVVSLRIDSAGGTMTVISTAAAEVIPALESLRGIASATMSGSVSRESVAGARVQRVAIRFRRAADSSGADSRGRAR